jgi:hypothetical protein
MACAVVGSGSVLIGPAKPVCPTLANERSGLGQCPHSLFEEEGIPLGSFDQERLEGAHVGVPTDQRVEELVRGGRWQHVESKLLIIGLTAPGVPMLGTVADEQEHRRRRHALDQGVEKGLSLRVAPMEVLEDQQQRLNLALAKQEPLEGLERMPAALGRIEPRPLGILDGDVEE